MQNLLNPFVPQKYVMLSLISEWAINAHRETNQRYGKVYPYELHLNWTASVAERFLKDVDNKIRDFVLSACYLHDLIEDARVTYNDVKNVAGTELAEITRLLTTDIRGRNRKERANAEYYEGLRSNEVAKFVKMCDRIANMEFGKFLGGSMLEKYREELPDFLNELDLSEDHSEMVDYITQI